MIMNIPGLSNSIDKIMETSDSEPDVQSLRFKCTHISRRRATTTNHHQTDLDAHPQKGSPLSIYLTLRQQKLEMKTQTSLTSQDSIFINPSQQAQIDYTGLRVKWEKMRSTFKASKLAGINNPQANAKRLNNGNQKTSNNELAPILKPIIRSRMHHNSVQQRPRCHTDEDGIGQSLFLRHIHFGVNKPKAHRSQTLIEHIYLEEPTKRQELRITQVQQCYSHSLKKYSKSIRNAGLPMQSY